MAYHVTCIAELTATQRRVARMLVLGHERTAIAAALRISAKTFDTHRLAILGRLGLSNTVQLVHRALQERFVAFAEIGVTSVAVTPANEEGPAPVEAPALRATAPSLRD